MKKFVTLLLALMTIFVMTVPAFATKEDQEIRVNCSKCQRVATRVLYYSKEKWVRDETKHENGATYIRHEMVVPNDILCDVCGKYTGARYTYWTPYELMGYDA